MGFFQLAPCFCELYFTVSTPPILCGGLEGENEPDCEYYCGQMIGFTKAKELLSEGAEEACDE